MTSLPHRREETKASQSVEAGAPCTLEVRDLVKSFGALQAVRGVSFQAGRGQVIGLLGPNGAGKTTTMHMLSGVLRPDQGSIRVAGELDPCRPAVRRRLGIAPQSIALYPSLTPRENLAFFGRLQGLRGTRLRDRVEQMVTLAGLADRATTRVGTFSGGMQRRLNLAAALIHEPAMLLLDEPTVGVDPQSRAHLFDILSKLRDDGLTIICSTHHMEEAERLCDRVAIIDHGKILAEGSVPELVRAHGGAASVRVELSEPLSASLMLPGVHVEGDHVRSVDLDPGVLLTALVKAGARLRRVEVTQPDLQDVFIALTGRSLRD